MDPIWVDKSYLLLKQALYVLHSQKKQHQGVKVTLGHWKSHKSSICKNLYKAFRLEPCLQGQRKVFHSATGQGSVRVFVVCICVKERAGWCETTEREAHSSQSASLHFSRALHFSLGHLSQTRIRERTHSAPLLRSHITQNRASLPLNRKKHQPVLNGTNTCVHTYLIWGNGCRWHLHTPRARWHHTYFSFTYQTSKTNRNLTTYLLLSTDFGFYTYFGGGKSVQWI